MPISVTCACGTKLTAPDAASGKAATCPKCKARLKLPSMVATNNPPVGATTPVPPSAPGPVAKRQGFPLWILAVGILTVGTLFLSCIGGVGFVAYRWGSGTKPAAPLQDTAEAKAPNKGPDEKGPDQPGKPAEGKLTFEAVNLDVLYAAYRDNEAAADAKYLNKGVQFTFKPTGIEKEPSGGYCVWTNLLDSPQVDKFGKHYKCHFRADQAAALAEFKLGQSLMIRGVCAGKTGMIRTSNGFVGQYGGTTSDPVVEFKGCEVVEKSKKVARVSIRADLPWQDSGVDVPANSEIVAKVEGTWNKGKIACGAWGLGSKNVPEPSAILDLREELQRIKMEPIPEFAFPAMPDPKLKGQQRTQAIKEYNQKAGRVIEEKKAWEESHYKKVAECAFKLKIEQQKFRNRLPVKNAPAMCLIAKFGTDGTPFVLLGFGSPRPTRREGDFSCNPTKLNWREIRAA